MMSTPSVGWARRVAPVAAVLVTAAAIDLVAKAVAEAWLVEGTVRGRVPFVDLSLSFNRGISFSLFPAHDPSSLALLLAIQGTLTCLVAGWALAASGGLERLGLAAIAGGAAGNFLDRLMDGAVTDYLDLHTGGIRWFTFNLADVWISAGVVLLLLEGLPGRRGRHLNVGEPIP
ncbi:MAG: signal peptidase II [Methylobacteriaceae bacterium]|jgi:signal peptidase II|uniref:Lipoprotein signal peptidase n=5 Tax=Methylorubrum extorquens TaxID=408 RepID=C5B3S8_METEA|nr:signal peptidase II [Methylorubrum extorquens]ACS43110.1 Signal peptidase II [Methylorubrum extorquens AM1]AWI88005.1 signal peptidase II [Methylobacterium sp. DM1]MCG5248758.1 signal peptidase II [Methylorubrum extorquens]WHQ71063.1 signal peptidase II [Methylorubrum extorquens]CAX22872.1 putative prolipoprotein signal peptidase (SPase II) [Methylorubrum extorquens DM4]